MTITFSKMAPDSIRDAVDARGQILDSTSLSVISQPAGDIAASPIAVPGVPDEFIQSYQTDEVKEFANTAVESTIQEGLSKYLEFAFKNIYAINAESNYGPLFVPSAINQGQIVGKNVGLVFSSLLDDAEFINNMIKVDSDLRAAGYQVGSREYNLGYLEGWGRNGLNLAFATAASIFGPTAGLPFVPAVLLAVGLHYLVPYAANIVANIGEFYGSRMDRPYWWWSPMKWMSNDQYLEYLENRGTENNTSESTSDLFSFVYPNDDTWDNGQNKYYFSPICPPPFCDDNGGGGGGGAAVGGVSLDKAAQVLVNLNDITGASYDPKTGQVTLIGRKDLSLPPMNMDDLAVAIRSVYGGENPGVTMVPVDPTMQDITQRVEYFGQTQNTHFGQVMFEADRYLKSLAAGTDTLTHQPVNPGVPGFKSELDLALEMNSGDTPWHRNWFVPGEIVLKKSQDGNSMVFDQATIQLESRFIKFMPDGSVEDVPGSSPVTNQFTSFMDKNYDKFAAGKPELAELVQLAKIVGFVRWLHDNNVPVDLSWVNDYPVKNVDTPVTTPGIKAEKSNGSSSIVSMGGVDFSSDNTYVSDTSGATDVLAKQATASRPADLPVSWDFQDNGQTLTAVAFNVAPARIVGGYTTSVTDISVPFSGGQTASFTRLYNSLDPRAGDMGTGWSQLIPDVTFQTVPVAGSNGSYYTKAVVTVGTN